MQNHIATYQAGMYRHKPWSHKPVCAAAYYRYSGQLRPTKPRGHLQSVYHRGAEELPWFTIPYPGTPDHRTWGQAATGEGCNTCSARHPGRVGMGHHPCDTLYRCYLDGCAPFVALLSPGELPCLSPGSIASVHAVPLGRTNLAGQRRGQQREPHPTYMHLQACDPPPVPPCPVTDPSRLICATSASRKHPIAGWLPKPCPPARHSDTRQAAATMALPCTAGWGGLFTYSLAVMWPQALSQHSAEPCMYPALPKRHPCYCPSSPRS